ncbi:hypothetical protein BDV96DRAFT_641145 [Lophiotrema nucula]|uniref:ribonuclease H n=1 Tax=Lophiotrema nucula TaxID=690887 RepID=A0A6A5ZQF9_9PLEO|nr:hypothetical protein BDV96DRAFT_641145 [Lophiotrema nucula]
MGAPDPQQSRITHYFQTAPRQPESNMGGEPSRSIATSKDSSQLTFGLPTPSPSTTQHHQVLSSVSPNVRSVSSSTGSNIAPSPNVPVAYMYPSQAGYQVQPRFGEQSLANSRLLPRKQPVTLNRGTPVYDIKVAPVPFVQQQDAQQGSKPTHRPFPQPSAKALAPFAHSNNPPSTEATFGPLTSGYRQNNDKDNMGMNLDWTLPGIGLIRPTVGTSSASAIDLTDDEPAQTVPLVPAVIPVQIPPKRTRGGARMALKHSSRHNGDCEVLTSHKNLGVFKDRHFKELRIQNEYTIVRRAAAVFDKTQLKTVIPSQYLRSALTGRNAALAGHKKAKGIGSGRRALFPGQVETLGPVAAVKQAYEEHTTAKIDPSRLVLWTDASGARGGHGFAVAYREASSSQSWAAWSVDGFSAHGALASVDQLESIAVIKACEIVIRRATASPGQYKSVSIYSDSLTFLKQVKHSQDRKNRGDYRLVDKVIRKATIVKKEHKIKISLHWVPGHSKVPGNELADRVAGIAAGHRIGPGSTETIELSDGEGEEWESDDEDKFETEL